MPKRINRFQLIIPILLLTSACNFAQPTTAPASPTTTPAPSATIPPTPTGSQSAIDWSTWTPGPSEITADNNGMTYTFVLTSRFSLVLEESDYPRANLHASCTPSNILGQISNVEPVPPDYYVIRYEGTAVGSCTLADGNFQVVINIIPLS